MEEQEQQPEEPLELSEFIQLGDIKISSRVYDVNTLGGILVELLKKKEVKEYLDIIKSQKKMNGGSYLG